MELVNDVLDLSKLNSDKFQFNLKPFNLAQIINDKFTALEISARESEISLNVKIDEGVCETVIGDKRRITQIITNIINKIYVVCY